MKKLILLFFFLIFLTNCQTKIYEKAQLITLNNAISINNIEKKYFLNNLNRTVKFYDQSKLEITKLYSDNKYLVELIDTFYYDALENKPLQTTYKIKIKNNYSNKLFFSKTELNESGANELISVDIFNDLIYIAYVTTYKNDSSSINLRVINLDNFKYLYDKAIYQQKWGINRINLAVHPQSNLLLISYNDFSKPNTEYLYFGSVQLDNNGLPKDSLKPKSIFNKDDTEKMYPKFIKDNDRLFLYHTSGSIWGLFSYSGKQGIGISEVEPNGELINYSLIFDKLKIDKNIVIKNGMVYYRTINPHGNFYESYNKILLNKLFKPFT